MKAIKLIRRFIKRKAEWRKAHPLELLESQMSQMAQEEEEEIPPMEDEKRKKKKGCIGKVCSKLGHLILGTKEEEEDDEVAMIRTYRRRYGGFNSDEERN